MFTPTLDQLLEVIPSQWQGSNHALTAIDNAYPALLQAAQLAKINTPVRWAHFASQLIHESMGFTVTVEIWGVNGGTAQQKKYEPGYETAAPGETTLAQRLGNTQPGDGYRFRGRGFIEETGRGNYTAAASRLGMDLVNHPELLGELPGAALISADYWNTRNLNEIADTVSDPTKAVTAMTHKINGGLLGLADRLSLFNICMKAWNSKPALVLVATSSAPPLFVQAATPVATTTIMEQVAQPASTTTCPQVC